MRFTVIDWQESENRGKLKTTVRELKDFLGWTLGPTARRIKKLQQKGLIKLLSRGLWQVSLNGLPLVPPIGEQHVPLIGNKLGSNIGNKGRKGKEEDQNSVSQDSIETVRTEKDYQELKEKQGFTALTTDDMYWLDKNTINKKTW